MEFNLDDIIKSSKKILLLSHVNPDGDTLGSMCAMYSMILKRFKKKADMSVVSNIPYNYKFLPNIDLAQRYFDHSLVYDLVITLDVAAIDRVRDAKIFFDKGKCRVNIDHHKTNPAYGDYNLIEPDASSCGEVLYNYFKKHNWEITEEAAVCLYTAIMTDTGNFRFENTSPNALRAAAELVELGVSPIKEYRACYESKPLNMVQFQAHIVNNTIYHNNGQIAITKISKEDMARFNATDDFTEGIVETIRTAQCVEISALLK